MHLSVSGTSRLVGEIHTVKTFLSAENNSILILESMRRMEQWTQVNNRSCIQFRPKTPDDPIGIVIQNGSGCSAYVWLSDGEREESIDLS